jgi:thiosulfate/3-mercaptopyruvate sulfurtransferase
MKTATLVDSPSLLHQLDDPSLRIIDCSAHLRRALEGGPYTVESGRAGYNKQHIRSAVFADIPGVLSDTSSPFPFALPTAETFAQGVSDLGVGPDTNVVVYSQESVMWATRLWWLFRYFGFDRVRVLDGGLTSWMQYGLVLTSDVSDVTPASFRASPRDELLATKSDVLRVVSGEPGCLVNALTPEAYRGEGPGAYSRPGRIPTSLNVPSRHLLDASGTFLSKAKLRRAFRDALAHDPSSPLIMYCGGGISATVDVFALSMIGHNDIKLYDGSLTEWTADNALPVEVG